MHYVCKIADIDISNPVFMLDVPCLQGNPSDADSLQKANASEARALVFLAHAHRPSRVNLWIAEVTPGPKRPNAQKPARQSFASIAIHYSCTTCRYWRVPLCMFGCFAASVRCQMNGIWPIPGWMRCLSDRLCVCRRQRRWGKVRGRRAVLLPGLQSWRTLRGCSPATGWVKTARPTCRTQSWNSASRPQSASCSRGFSSKYGHHLPSQCPDDLSALTPGKSWSISCGVVSLAGSKFNVDILCFTGGGRDIAAAQT